MLVSFVAHQVISDADRRPGGESSEAWSGGGKVGVVRARGGEVRRLAFDVSLPATEALGRIRDQFRAHDQGAGHERPVAPTFSNTDQREPCRNHHNDRRTVHLDQPRSVQRAAACLQCRRRPDGRIPRTQSRGFHCACDGTASRGARHRRVTQHGDLPRGRHDTPPNGLGRLVKHEQTAPRLHGTSSLRLRDASSKTKSCPRASRRRWGRHVSGTTEANTYLSCARCREYLTGGYSSTTVPRKGGLCRTACCRRLSVR
jgi:hypothetical protein